ncbi:MAG TPA: transketolase C-terminal domain-containing protein [Bdellovibrionota bacterium]|nr:transketolase C-terminal domain-containing protein [Bdellovibrionota bacterium]
MANMAQAIRLALHYGETHLGVTDIFGEDVGAPLGGVFTCTQGLKSTWNTPLDERGIIGTAIGLALAGGKPVAEIQFCDYIFNTIDLLKLAGNSCWSSNGQYPLSMVVMTPSGAGIHGSLYHSHSFDAWATRLAGWKVVMPSNPADAYGLMLAAIEDPNPVLFMAPKALIRVKGETLIAGEPASEKELKEMIDAPIGDARKGWKPKWPKLEFTPVELGKGSIARDGSDAVVVTYGRHVHIATKVADELASEGRGSVRVVDLRSLYPYDWNLISESLRNCGGRILFLNEDTEITNFGEHLLRRTIEEHYYELRARPRLIAGRHVPGVGLAPPLEDASIPQAAQIKEELTALLAERT